MLRVRAISLLKQVRLMGSIRSAGGSIAKRGEYNEEEYFRKKRQQQLEQLRLKKKPSLKSLEKIERSQEEVQKPSKD